MNQKEQDDRIQELFVQLQRRCGTYYPHGFSTDEKYSLRESVRGLDHAYQDILFDWLIADYEKVHRRFRFYSIAGDLIILLTILISAFAEKDTVIYLLGLYFFGGYYILHARLEPWKQQVDLLKQIKREVESLGQRSNAQL